MTDRLEVELSKQKKLIGYERLFVKIPKALILDDSLGERRVTILSYFLLHAGMTGCVNYSINKIVEWVGKKPNGHKGKINQKFAEDILSVEEGGYIELVDKPANLTCCTATIKQNALDDLYDNGGYAMLYVDELEKIMNHVFSDESDKRMSNEIVLLVFAYLRKVIYQRPNKISDNVGAETRRARSPDAYDCHYNDIADVLGLSERQVSKAVDVLNDLGLIYSETLPRKKIGDRWTTSTTVFCNRYKREKGYLLESGSGYYMKETENKKKKIASYGSS